MNEPSKNKTTNDDVVEKDSAQVVKLNSSKKSKRSIILKYKFIDVSERKHQVGNKRINNIAGSAKKEELSYMRKQRTYNFLKGLH